jgi:hypothetical protein
VLDRKHQSAGATFGGSVVVRNTAGEYVFDEELGQRTFDDEDEGMQTAISDTADNDIKDEDAICVHEAEWGFDGDSWQAQLIEGICATDTVCFVPARHPYDGGPLTYICEAYLDIYVAL